MDLRFAVRRRTKCDAVLGLDSAQIVYAPYWSEKRRNCFSIGHTTTYIRWYRATASLAIEKFGSRTMAEKCEIGDGRYVVVRKDEISLFSDGSDKCTTLTYPQWMHFVGHCDEIDQCVAKVVAKDDGVKL
jgi:hypothetical protein